MLHRARHGWVEVVAGVMFSGKSEELIRRVRRTLIAGRRVQLFKSHLDDRYGGQFSISSHDGRQIDAEPVSNSVQVAEKVRPATQVVAIDEAQFLDDGICEVADALADAGMRVIVAGTDMDFRGEPFGPMGLLLARAERIDKLHAILRRVRRSGDEEPAPHRRKAGARGGPDDPGGKRRVLRGALPPLPRRAEARSSPEGAVAEAWGGFPVSHRSGPGRCRFRLPRGFPKHAESRCSGRFRDRIPVRFRVRGYRPDLQSARRGPSSSREEADLFHSRGFRARPRRGSGFPSGLIAGRR